MNKCFKENQLEWRNAREDIALFRGRERDFYPWIHHACFLKAGYRSFHFTMIAGTRNIPNLQ